MLYKINLKNKKVGDTIVIYDNYARENEKLLTLQIEKIGKKYIYADCWKITFDGKAYNSNTTREAFNSIEEYKQCSSYSPERKEKIEEITKKLRELTIRELEKVLCAVECPHLLYNF